jgi:hypothetical protein
MRKPSKYTSPPTVTDRGMLHKNAFVTRAKLSFGTPRKVVTTRDPYVGIVPEKPQRTKRSKYIPFFLFCQKQAPESGGTNSLDVEFFLALQLEINTNL